MSKRVVVIGGGYLGSAIAAALNGGGVQALSTSRRPAGEHVRLADVRSLDSLEGALEGVTNVVHAASYIGSDPDQARSVNVVGTANVVRAAAKVGANRLVYLSTAAVYGMGPHRALEAQTAPLSPTSVATRTRIEAEEIVRRHQGLVVRPNLVLGDGDRWVFPAIRALVALCEGIPESARAARVSVIEREVLGTAVAQLLALDRFWESGTVALNAVEPRPQPTVAVIDRALARPGASQELPTVSDQVATQAAERLGFSPHQLDLLLSDHWLDPGAFADLF